MLDAVAAECVRSPVVTWSAAHLEAIVAEQLLRAGAALLERGNTAAEEKLVRLTEQVLKVERVSLEPRHRFRAGRGRRVADLRVLDPVHLAVDLWARSSAAASDRLGGRALRERLAALVDGHVDALVLACDRRVWDALRVERPGADGEPSEVSRLCALLLPPSSALADDASESTPRLGGRGYRVNARVTPMVFGVQRVVAAVWPSMRPAELPIEIPQLDAFEAIAG